MAARDRVALHSSKNWLSTVVKVMVGEPFVRGPAWRACRGACEATTSGRNRR